LIQPARAGLSRRGLFGRLGVAGAAGAVVASGGLAAADHAQALTNLLSPGTDTVEFRGTHQAGIVTAAQDRMVFGAFDLATSDSDQLRSLLMVWTAAAEQMTRGRQVPGTAGGEFTAASDTGEALGEPAGRLTITIGYGPSLFSKLGLAGRRPALLAELPPLAPENLDELISDGDVCIQACAEDPQVAFHAVRNLGRLASGVLTTRWLQIGFGRTSSTSSSQKTPRNLMGFKDGTRNITADQTGLVDDYVWSGPESEQDWMLGGSYLVARKIRMFLERWDRDSLGDQQNTFGRAKNSGAPLTGTTEFQTPDFRGLAADGTLAISPNAHIRLAAHENNGGLRLLRRGYSYTDGVDPQTLLLDSGLFFIAFMRDPSQFVRLQQQLGAADALNEYIQHIGSAVFACPRGLTAREDWGTQILG
jgi:deferrochelatase/peroxidase EfeB